jgi:hypothetical protein
VTYDSYTQATITQQLQTDAADAVEAASADLAYDLELLDVSVEQTNTVLFRRVEGLAVTVGVPPGESHVGLAGEIAARTADTVDRDIAVQVQYVTAETA